MQLSADHIGGLHGKGQGLVRGKGGHVGHLQLLPILGDHQHQLQIAGTLRGQIGGKKKPYDRGNVLIIRLLCGFRDVICRQKGWNRALFLNLLP